MKLLRVLCVSLALVASPALAQDTPPTDDGSLDLANLTTFLERQQGYIEEIQRELDTNFENAQQAEIVYDNMVAAYRNLIESVGSSSDTIARIDEFIAFAGEQAEAAAGSQVAEVRALAAEFEAQAVMAGQVRAAFVEEAARAVTLIDELEDFREVAVFRFRLRQGEAVLAGFQEQLQTIRDATGRVQQVVDDARAGGLPVVGPAPVQQ